MEVCEKLVVSWTTSSSALHLLLAGGLVPVLSPVLLGNAVVGRAQEEPNSDPRGSVLNEVKQRAAALKRCRLIMSLTDTPCLASHYHEGVRV